MLRDSFRRSANRYAANLMTILARIDSDCKSLRSYFNKFLEVLQQARAEDRAAPVEALDAGASESLASYHSFSHFVKPDMITNIYSLVDYWMREICGLHRRKNGLSLSYKDIRGKNDLHAYQKYLIRYVGIDLKAVESSYQRLDDLREVRNLFIHGGGHVPNGKEDYFSRIDGITLQGSLIVLDESFIWNTLDHAKIYLSAAAQI